MTSRDFLLRAGIAASLAVSALSHAHLYIHGYKHIPNIGEGFLAQASVSFALAVLILVGGPSWLRWAAASIAAGSVVAFAISRTVGLLDFTERGWDPSPYAAVSLGAEVATVVLCIAGQRFVAARRRRPETAMRSC